MKFCRLSNAGIKQFEAWLGENQTGLPPASFLDAPGAVEPAYDADFDETLEFSSRYELGSYLVQQLTSFDFVELLSSENDGMWAWLTIKLFSQLSPGKHKRHEHYVVTRSGPAGSLAYRHAVRTSFELTYIHGQGAMLCLGVPMHTWGEMAEQLTSRQAWAHNRVFFEAARSLYVAEGKLLRGAATKPKKVHLRKAGDRAGFGGVRRLALAMQRLDLTYDTEAMKAERLTSMLPKEFSKWRERAAA